MKKLIAIAVSLLSIGFVASSAEAKAPSARTAAAAPQVYGQNGRGRDGNRDRRFNHRARTVTQTRMVRAGRRVFRETYQITYWPNGRTQTRLISRVRVR